MKDLIERQAAIDAFYAATADGDKAEWCEYVLRDVPSFDKDINVSCKDAISRRAAINKFCELLDTTEENPVVCIRQVLDTLPSVQQEIIRCKDCKYWQDQEEGIVEVPICARPQNKYEKFPLVMLIDGDGFCSYAERKTDE